MATRANILLIDDRTNERIMLYRNYDGYPEGAGASLERIRAMINFNEIPKETDKVFDITIQDIAKFMVDMMTEGTYVYCDWYEDYIDYAYQFILSYKPRMNTPDSLGIEIKTFERYTKEFEEVTGIQS